MTRTVHLLKFYKENAEFLHQTLDERLLIALLNKGKKYDRYIRKIVNDYNIKMNITSKSELYKALTVPRFKILTALIAWRGAGKCVDPLCLRRLKGYLTKAPQRFKDFGKLLVPGFWFVGRVIEDSLSDDPSINCGNPFGFLPGDMGFWWAGVVAMDYINYGYLKKYKRKEKEEGIKEEDKSYETCLEFYNDGLNLSRKYKYYQMSALSNLDRLPWQFLATKDQENFQNTISNVKVELLNVESLKQLLGLLDKD